MSRLTVMSPVRLPASAPRGRRRTPALYLTVLALLFCLLLVPVGAIGLSLSLQRHLENNITRLPRVFAGLDHRPSRPTSGRAAKAVNILLLGTDRRSRVPTTGTAARAAEWEPGAQRSDTMMVVHVDGDRRGVSVISIPRDSWVTVPGYGQAKVNAAFSWGGPALAVRTVEALTGVRIDHLAVVDWAGFTALTDAVGGVEVDVPRTVYDSSHRVTWTAGRHWLDGRSALDYVRMRYGLPNGDLDRVRRQQYFLRQLLHKALAESLLKHPVRTYRMVDLLSRHLSVDAGWSTSAMSSLLLGLGGLDAGDVHYLTVPVAGTGYVGAQSVVRIDRHSARTLWQATRDDRVEQWLRGHRVDELRGRAS